MAQFPGSEASFTGFTAGHTLAADSHASQHNSEQAEITATQHKIGTGSSTPTSGLLLRGNGVGTSAWAQANLTSDVTGVLPQANGGTGTTLATGSGNAVYQTSPSLTTPTISTPTITAGGSWAGSPSLTTPTIADFSNSTHTHANNAGGGTLNGASAIQSATLKAAQMFHGIVSNRQGGTTGDGAWNTSGTSNTDTSAKDVLIQCGALTLTASTVITFPTAYSQIPIVVVTPITSGTQNTWGRISAITATNFTAQLFINNSTGATSETMAWIAMGQ